MIKKFMPPCIYILLGCILMFLFMKNCSGERDVNVGGVIANGDKTVVVKLTTKLDTIYQKRYVHDTVTVSKPSLVRIDTVFVDGSKVVQVMPKIHRVYQDSITPVDSVQVKYIANTTGTLDAIHLDFKDTRSERFIIKTNEIQTTITNNIKPSGFYIGLGSDIGLTRVTPKLQYLNDKNLFEVNYNIVDIPKGYGGLGFSYSRKL